jgi:Vam6/Vps39-like protein vacuolar protein sorting-associated protein 39
VLDFLLRVQPSQVIPYLEHLINVWEEKSDLIHNALVHQYRAKIQQLLSTGEEGKEEAAALRKKLIAFLETSHHYNPQVVIVLFPQDCTFKVKNGENWIVINYF